MHPLVTDANTAERLAVCPEVQPRREHMDPQGSGHTYSVGTPRHDGAGGALAARSTRSSPAPLSQQGPGAAPCRLDGHIDGEGHRRGQRQRTVARAPQHETGTCPRWFLQLPVPDNAAQGRAVASFGQLPESRSHARLQRRTFSPATAHFFTSPLSRFLSTPAPKRRSSVHPRLVNK